MAGALMGLRSWLIEKKLGGENVGKIAAAIAWLNAVPGRKRGIAAVLLGSSAALRALGHAGIADSLTALDGVVQTYLIPGADVGGMVMAVWGVFAAKKL